MPRGKLGCIQQFGTPQTAYMVRHATQWPRATTRPKRHFECLEHDRDMAIVFQVELRQSTKFMEEFSTTKLAEYFQIIRQIIEAGQLTGLFRPQLNSRVVAKILFGALDEMATNWVVSRNNYPLTGMVDAVLDIFLHGVSSQHATA